MCTLCVYICIAYVLVLLTLQVVKCMHLCSKHSEYIRIYVLYKAEKLSMCMSTFSSSHVLFCGLCIHQHWTCMKPKLCPLASLNSILKASRAVVFPRVPKVHPCRLKWLLLLITLNNKISVCLLLLDLLFIIMYIVVEIQLKLLMCLHIYV